MGNICKNTNGNHNFIILKNLKKSRKEKDSILKKGENLEISEKIAEKPL